MICRLQTADQTITMRNRRIRKMRRKTEQLVVSFHTTADAMAMEQISRERKLPGRLIPVPRMISAGCGLAWRTDPDEEERVRALIEEGGIDAEGIYRCML